MTNRLTFWGQETLQVGIHCILLHSSAAPFPGEVFDGLVADFAERLRRSYPQAQLEVSDQWREDVLQKIGGRLRQLSLIPSY